MQKLPTGTILGADGNPLPRQRRPRRVAARYDAAQTAPGNELHWQWADTLDPHSANSLAVRKRLRSRSRYEVIENNPYLKGVMLTICNDFVGSGPKLQVTDQRISPERQRLIEQRWQQWSQAVRFRRKLWRMRMAKLVDGEGFMRAYNNRRNRHPVRLDFHVVEADQVSSEDFSANVKRTRETRFNEIDGVRFDNFDNPLFYHILDFHPGGASNLLFFNPATFGGKWVNADNVIHWFRQDRGWLRGIPETTPSLPLCAILRRYTLATVRNKEFAADFAGVMETEGPPDPRVWTDGQGNLVDDDPFDTFPIQAGLFTTLPWGYKLKQLEAVPDGQSYDDFVSAILREITRPILAPYNVSAGTSKDSNMASGVLDSYIYRGGQESERHDAQREVLDPAMGLWWNEGMLTPGYFDDPVMGEGDFLNANPSMRLEPPEHTWRWDPVGIDHTDPTKVMGALDIALKAGFITDRDIQETRFNRNVEDWQEDVRQQQAFREEVGLEIQPQPEPPSVPGEGEEAPDDAEE